MITLAQAESYLDEALGVTVPGYLLQAAVDEVGALEPEMVTAGYSTATRVRVQSMAVALVAGADFARKVASQAAPSGASRSFKNADAAITALRRALSALDTAGVCTDLVGPDPAASTLLMVV